MNKYNIGDILEAKQSIQLSSWSKEKCKKGQRMQIAEVSIKISHNGRVETNYQLCFPEEAPFFRMEVSEEYLLNMFKKVSEDTINYCQEWLSHK